MAKLAWSPEIAVHYSLAFALAKWYLFEPVTLSFPWLENRKGKLNNPGFFLCLFRCHNSYQLNRKSDVAKLYSKHT